MVKASMVLASFPMTLDTAENLGQMLDLLAQCDAHEVVIFPEGSLSGYSDDMAFLMEVNLSQVNAGLDRLHRLALEKHLHVFAGAIRQDDQGWRNQAHYLSPTGQRAVYNQANLATHERGHLVPGESLPVIDVALPGGTLRVGVQLCREIRFPEQWRALSDTGVKLFIYMTHAINDEPHQPVWRSHLISRAAEHQRWVAAVNVAHRAQTCPSLVIDPTGLVMREAVSETAGLLRTEIDTSAVSNWYLNQRRTDLTRALSREE